jgi:AcrR family transcriptional regulator
MDLEIDKRGQQLLTGTVHLFMRFGIKSMTMDDISRQLGVSKKTLYLYVSDKKRFGDQGASSIGFTGKDSSKPPLRQHSECD